MKVTIRRGGGLAGIVTRTEVDADDLSRQDAEALSAEIDRAGVRHLQQPAAGRRWPDELLYEIALDDGGEAVSLRFTDETIPAEVRRLVDWIDARPERSYGVEA